uniref:DNA topoisomerase (ATP-hydrolyzing) n=1 Tax=viral metagenome TaxID=1070528 RepID=A0A6C0IF03_9ZZZZ
MSTTDINLANKYQQKTDKQHILDNPDTYIGSVEEVDSDLWILNENGEKIIEKNIKYIPGLFKLFDEGIVNCRDHVVRMQQSIANGQDNCIPVSNIEITIQEDGTIIMLNDGNGIDVAEHPEHKIWIPEMIFGHLRTSTNYDKTEKKIVGGKNGFGFKLVLIWSTSGSIETVDHIRGLKYIQEFKNNLDEICKPSITKCKNKPYTKIIFKPDYKRLGIDGLTSDMISLLKKRVYDVAAVTDKNLKVKYNSNLIPVKNFQQYIDMYIGDKNISPRVYEDNGTRWEYAVALTPTNEFVQISFVNGIHTAKGGKHVEYILNQITRKLVEFIEKKKKVKVNPNSIKEQLILFLRCDIENPAFDSQTKDFMNTPSSKFGSKCDVSDKFIEKVAKMGVMDAAVQLTEVKENKAAKKTDGTKTKSIRGIPKLTDANWAGTDKSKECLIIFCEGDSAKAGIISGLSSDDRNIIGVYPMKGKILNVRGEALKKISENKEIAEIKKILGLETGKKYDTIEDVYKNLRYGKILFMTDQDLDGSHIKGLGINLFQSEWPSLSEIPGFIGFMNTPILKAKKGNTELNFYNDGEFEEWKANNDINGWKIKYYKGLGTSTGKEFREYFEKKKIVGFEHSEKSNDAIDMVFNKKRADDRKDWLKYYDRNAYLDTNKTNVSYEEFINRELIHFSKYDCDRSIPNLMDGLKISLRKILFSAFKKNLNTEIKVAQFSGYVSEHSGYHHGEASLNGAIVGMAQNFVGSNNINLLLPNGQFGTRLQGGKDSASERYIFTQLNKLTRTIFPASDDNVLKYLNDDGILVEPVFYAPIIPMILINGSKGIGTGFSTDIMCYDPLQIIQYLKNKLQNIDDVIQFNPYYEGFKGTITKINDEKFLIKGLYEKIANDKIKVTELPVGFWTEDFKELLEELIEPSAGKDGKKPPSIIKDYDDMSKDTNVEFTITFMKGKLEELESSKGDYERNGLEKLLKLYTTNTTTNMHLFNAEDTLQKYNNIPDIINAYYDVRLKLYQQRKIYMINALEKELLTLTNKAKYIVEILNGTIDLRKKKKEEVIQMLVEKGYDILENDNDFKYLIKMPMDSVTEENVEKLLKDKTNKEYDLTVIKNTTINQMWMNELNQLKELYIEYKKERTRLMDGIEVENIKINKKIVSKGVIKKQTKKPESKLLLVEED